MAKSPDEDDHDTFDPPENSRSPDDLKSRVIHIRIDPVMLRKIKALAFRADKKPCAWVRRLIQRELDAQERRKRK